MLVRGFSAAEIGFCAAARCRPCYRDPVLVSGDSILARRRGQPLRAPLAALGMCVEQLSVQPDSLEISSIVPVLAVDSVGGKSPSDVLVCQQCRSSKCQRVLLVWVVGFEVASGARGKYVYSSAVPGVDVCDLRRALCTREGGSRGKASNRSECGEQESFHYVLQWGWWEELLSAGPLALQVVGSNDFLPGLPSADSLRSMADSDERTTILV